MPNVAIVQNHAPVWGAADFWVVDPEPEFVIGAAGDSSYLVWGISGSLSNESRKFNRGARIRTGDLLLPKRSNRDTNHGRKSRKSNWDCTILRFLPLGRVGVCRTEKAGESGQMEGI